LGSTSDHVLDEITVTRSIDDGDHVLRTRRKKSQSRVEERTAATRGKELLTLGVSNFQRAISMVIPRSRSALSLSRTHAYLKEPLPSSAASYKGC
jgi:hypothetical protein